MLMWAIKTSEVWVSMMSWELEVFDTRYTNAEDSRDAASIPELGRSPGVGNGNPLRYSCLENPMNRGAWRARGVAKSRIRLSDWACMHDHFVFFFVCRIWLDAWWCSGRLVSHFPAVLSENSCFPIHSPPRGKFSMALVWQKDNLIQNTKRKVIGTFLEI